MFKSGISVVVCAALSLLVITGCTTSNQQALGVGVKPEPKTAAAPAVPESTNPASNGEPAADNTQTALAPVSETTPSETAVSNVAASGETAPTVTATSRVGFLPITGAPRNTVVSLSRALGTAAKQRNIAVSGTGTRNVNYQLKGYMSALNEGASTTVTFYWDVLDRSGRRLFRINGFERQNGARTDPWAGVSASTINRIANRTMSDLATWLKRKGA